MRPEGGVARRVGRRAVGRASAATERRRGQDVAGVPLSARRSAQVGRRLLAGVDGPGPTASWTSAAASTAARNSAARVARGSGGRPRPRRSMSAAQTSAAAPTSLTQLAAARTGSQGILENIQDTAPATAAPAPPAAAPAEKGRPRPRPTTSAPALAKASRASSEDPRTPPKTSWTPRDSRAPPPGRDRQRPTEPPLRAGRRPQRAGHERHYRSSEVPMRLSWKQASRCRALRRGGGQPPRSPGADARTAAAETVAAMSRRSRQMQVPDSPPPIGTRRRVRSGRGGGGLVPSPRPGGTIRVVFRTLAGVLENVPGGVDLRGLGGPVLPVRVAVGVTALVWMIALEQTGAGYTDVAERRIRRNAQNGVEILVEDRAA